MNKAELIDAIAKEAKIAKTEANSVIDATTKAITSALKKRRQSYISWFWHFLCCEKSCQKRS